ncbi:MAG: DUF5979 domain-containing protein [Clostridiales Family XIII bacterium]|jgi:hypothetical protein|nr:DUF5979 domain-containing protein [Clostridiales Family XIII bacterium]
MFKQISAYSGLLHKVVMLLLSCVFVISAIGITFGWVGPLLHNTTYGSARLTVVLEKLERGMDGSATHIPVAGAEFYLYRVAASPSAADEQVGGRFVSNAVGQVYPPALSSGEYYFLETNPSPGYAYDRDSSGTLVRKYPFTVGKSKDPLTITAYNKRTIGSLTIEKTVLNADGSALTDEQRREEFSFAVTFGDGGEYEYSVNGGALHLLSSGAALKLRHGDQAVFPKLPTGLRYTITEAAVTKGTQITSLQPQVRNDAGEPETAGAAKQGGVTSNAQEGDGNGGAGNGDAGSAGGGGAGGGSGGDVGAGADGGGADGETGNSISDVTDSEPSGDVTGIENDTPVLPENYDDTDAPKADTRGALTPNEDTGYWHVQSDNHTGNITEGGIVAKFVNTWNDDAIVPATTFITVRKAVTGEAPAADNEREFRFTLTVDGGATRFTLKNGESKSFPLPVGAVYDVREEDYLPESYRGSITNGYGTADAALIDAVQTNDYFGLVTVDITGEVIWDSNGYDKTLPSSVTVLLKSGGRIVDSIVVLPDADGRWLYTFTDLPKYEADGVTLATYTIEEVPLGDWVTSYNGYTIINVYNRGGAGEPTDTGSAITNPLPPQGDKDRPEQTGKPAAPPQQDNQTNLTNKLTPKDKDGAGKDGLDDTATGGAVGKPDGGKGNAPGTGDNSKTALWVTLLTISGMGLIIIIVERKCRRRRC